MSAKREREREREKERERERERAYGASEIFHIILTMLYKQLRACTLLLYLLSLTYREIIIQQNKNKTCILNFTADVYFATKLRHYLELGKIRNWAINCILETHEGVFWPIWKTQMKCHIM